MIATLLKTIIQTTRPSFLVLTPICVLLGLSTSFDSQAGSNNYLAFFIFIGALFAHISVNTLNEYFDFKSGLDLNTDRTPFSGGSGALPDYPAAAKLTLVAGWVSLLMSVLVGIYLVFERGNLVLPIGLVGVALVITYTQWLNRWPFLCLIAPGLGFGTLMVVGTHVVLSGSYSELPLLVSLVPFFLINNLLLLNQYPDIEPDAMAGRRTFPIAYGTTTSNIVYALFLVAGYALILFYLYRGYIPALGVLALLPMACSLYSLSGAVRYSSDIGNHPKYMGANVAAAVLTPLLLAVAILNG